MNDRGGRDQYSRRAFVRTLGGLTATAGGTGTAVAQDDGETTTAGGTATAGGDTAGGTTATTGGGGGQAAKTFKFGGRVAGWQGPQSFQGPKTNPTLNLQSGTKYKVIWRNLDGAPHNFMIQDANGNSLASTETMSNEGETLSLTFTATEEMSQYICTVHPTTMVADITFGGGQNGGRGAAQQEADPEEMGVPFQAHFVGIATILMMIVSLIYTFFVVKYGESPHASGSNR